MAYDMPQILEIINFQDAVQFSLAVLSSAMNHLQRKSAKLEDNAGRVALILKSKKCKILRANTNNEATLAVAQNEVEDNLLIRVKCIM